MTQAAKKVQMNVPDQHLHLFEDMVLGLATATDIGKTKQDASEWVVTAFFDPRIDDADVQNCMKEAADSCGLNSEEHSITIVSDEDWQSKMREDFPPLEAGDFFIHSFDETAPEGKISLHIPAGMAFGTGEHSTTYGCLVLYSDLSQKTTFKNGLDMGCGSGILALGATKKQNTPFLAVDIDAPSIDICKENMDNNDASSTVISMVGNGFNTAEVSKSAPYDLIFANILASPLLQMADGLVNVLEKNGVAILSGFLTHQEEAIINAYTALGMEVTAREQREEWVALAMTKVG
jgi:ribosomal protein L11 methyltransferase